MTDQQKKIKREMVEQFLHWAKYNPTIVKEKFGISSIESLKYIISYMFKN
jgi:hypothetical protein